MLQIGRITTLSLIECDMFNNASYFISWKLKVQMFSKRKRDLRTKKVIVSHTDLKLFVVHVKEGNAKKITIDSMKGHFIPHIAKKMGNEDMILTSIALYQSSCVSCYMLLRNKFSAIYMNEIDTMVI